MGCRMGCLSTAGPASSHACALLDTGFISRPSTAHHIPHPTSCLRHGFTFIELAVCLVIIGLLSAVTVVSLTGRHRTLKFEDVLNQVEQFDRRSRLRTVHSGQKSLIRIDARHTRLTHGTALDAPDQDVWTLTLPSGYTIDRVMSGGGSIQVMATPLHL